MAHIIYDDQIKKIEDKYESTYTESSEDKKNYTDMYSEEEIENIYNSGYRAALDFVIETFGLKIDKEK